MSKGQQNVQAMTAFRRNPARYLKQVKNTKKPLMLTVNGRTEAVVQDAEEYQRLLDLAALADEEEGIRQGMEDVRKGRVYDAREALEKFRRERGIPR